MNDMLEPFPVGYNRSKRIHMKVNEHNNELNRLYMDDSVPIILFRRGYVDLFHELKQKNDYINLELEELENLTEIKEQVVGENMIFEEEEKANE